MAKQRKIKHYRYGYSSKKYRRARIWKTLLFLLLLAAPRAERGVVGDFALTGLAFR